MTIVKLSNGDGTFTNVAPADLIYGSSSLITGDFNGDGLTDLFSFTATGSQGVNDFIKLSNGDGTFTSLQGQDILYGSSKLLTADFNGDGLTDLLSFTTGSQGVNDFVKLSNGDGTFTNVAPADLIYGSSSLITGDFNGDGLTDLLSFTTGSQGVNDFVKLSKWRWHFYKRSTSRSHLRQQFFDQRRFQWRWSDRPVFIYYW